MNNNTVFNNLYTFLRNKKSEEPENGIIVITGDLLHSKLSTITRMYLNNLQFT